MRGVRRPAQEKATYGKAKELIREGAFEDFENEGTVYVYAADHTGSGYVDSALVAETYDAVRQRRVRLMLNRIATGTVEPAAVAFGSTVRIARPRIKTLN